MKCAEILDVYIICGNLHALYCILLKINNSYKFMLLSNKMCFTCSNKHKIFNIVIYYYYIKKEKIPWKCVHENTMVPHQPRRMRKVDKKPRHKN